MIPTPVIPRTTKAHWRAIVLQMLAEIGATVTTLPSGLFRVSMPHGDSITCTDISNVTERDIHILKHRGT